MAENAPSVHDLIKGFMDELNAGTSVDRIRDMLHEAYYAGYGVGQDDLRDSMLKEYAKAMDKIP